MNSFEIINLLIDYCKTLCLDESFWACLFCEGQKSRALAAQSFCFEKKQKGFQTNRSITHAEM